MNNHLRNGVLIAGAVAGMLTGDPREAQTRQEAERVRMQIEAQQLAEAQQRQLDERQRQEEWRRQYRNG